MPESRVHLVAAARPNFMKIAPLWHALTNSHDFTPVLIHTGQHYDRNMSDEIFRDLRLPEPNHHLGVGSGSHAEQTGRVMIEYEKIAVAERPDWLIVAGDVNSTLACALTGAKLGIRVVHLEAGLRSRDRTMPEELNRLATDVLSDVLWTPSPDADANLLREGIEGSRITRVGNIMLDSFEMIRGRIEEVSMKRELGLDDKPYGVVTLHRPSNVDDVDQLGALVAAVTRVQQDLQLVFPVHPRTARRLDETGLRVTLERAGVLLIQPLPYIRFMSLVVNCSAVITDSGGIQEETTYLGIPCFTLRENTERPITIDEGTNRLTNSRELADAVRQGCGAVQARKPPEYWDGATAHRCVADLRTRIAAL